MTPDILTREQVAAMLKCIDAHDRHVWVRVCFSVKAALGDSGFDLWDDWSRSAPDVYNEKSARSTWRNASAEGGVGPGTLVEYAKQGGYRPDADVPAPTEAERREARARRRRERREAAKRREQEMARAAETARWIVAQCVQEKHPYLSGKGFPDAPGLVYKELLVVPMFFGRDIVNVQMFDAAGNKKFLKNSRLAGCWHAIGSRRTRELWLCEGYATGLSVFDALRRVPRTDVRVVVCFSDANMVRLSKVFRHAYVIADHDMPKPERPEYSPGLAAAEKTGLPYWSSNDYGDANDYHKARGLNALTNSLRAFLLERNRRTGS